MLAAAIVGSSESIGMEAGWGLWHWDQQRTGPTLNSTTETRANGFSGRACCTWQSGPRFRARRGRAAQGTCGAPAASCPTGPTPSRIQFWPAGTQAAPQGRGCLPRKGVSMVPCPHFPLNSLSVKLPKSWDYFSCHFNYLPFKVFSG